MLSATKLSSLPSYQKGYQEGYQEGYKKGLARSLRYLLAQKFDNLPNVIEQQMQNADDEQLLQWMGCVLQANALTDVFSL